MSDVVVTPEDRPASALDRSLRLFGDVRAGEGATVLLMCLNVFLLLMAYYVRRPCGRTLHVGTRTNRITRDSQAPEACVPS